jgi:ParB family chromosome partitioning protein
MGITIENLQVDDLHANPNNPRKQVGDVDELASSIRSQGIKQPLLVTPTGETDIFGHKQYRVVIGHRRLAAARQSGLSTVPAIVEEMDARREREIMLVENTQRSDLTPIEEADGYQGLLDLGVRVKEMAEKTGRSDRFVRRRLKIARIPQETRDMSADFSQLSLDQLDKLAEFESDPDMQRELARADDFDWTYQRLSQERRKTIWHDKALKALAKAGIKVESLPDGKNFWNWHPHGYKAAHSFSDINSDFWTSFTGESDWPEARVYSYEYWFCAYTPIPADELQKDKAKTDKDNAIKARGRELNRQAREFEAIAKANRTAWLKANLRTLTHEHAETGLCRLALADTVGWRSVFPYLSYKGEDVIRELIAFGWSLPITEHDDEHWSLECRENLDSIRMVLKDRPLRILDVLAARWESNIGWNYWRSRHGVDDMCCWYDVLERIGYRVSEDERKALKGAYLDGGDDES